MKESLIVIRYFSLILLGSIGIAVPFAYLMSGVPMNSFMIVLAIISTINGIIACAVGTGQALDVMDARFH